MAEESILTDDFLRELMNVGEVDILVGVPTHNDAKTVGQVVQAVRSGLLKHFPRQRAVIINADGGSRDATQELVRAASINDLQHETNFQSLRTLHSISTQYEGGHAEGRALHILLAAADLLHPSACAVISPHSTSIEPDWVLRLLNPVCREEFDYVTPVYRRHKFDGLLLRNLVYPMCRALYSRQIWEPRPSDFSFSGKMAAHLFELDIWSGEPCRTGASLLTTIEAITGRFKMAQVFLGDIVRVDHNPADLVEAMRNVLGPLFWSLEQNSAFWSSSNGSQPVPIIGGAPEVTTEPLRINRKRLYHLFNQGVSELEPVLRSILSGSTLAELQRISKLPEEEFCFSNDLWTKTAYEFAASFHRAVISRDHVIQALAPLYRGKTFTFLQENHEALPPEVERNVEALCLTFEQCKPELLPLWNGGK